MDIQNNICTQDVLNLYFSVNSMKNISSYCGLTDARMRSSGKDLPVTSNLGQSCLIGPTKFSFSFSTAQILGTNLVETRFVVLSDELKLDMGFKKHKMYSVFYNQQFLFIVQTFRQSHSRRSSSASQSIKSNEINSDIERLVQLQLQLHEWKEEDLNNYKRKIAQQKEGPVDSSSEEISALGEAHIKESPKIGKSNKIRV